MCLLTLVAPGVRGYDPGVIRPFEKLLLGLVMAAAVQAQTFQITSINNSLNDLSPSGPSGGICAGSYIDITLAGRFSGSQISVTLGQQQLHWYIYSLNNASGYIYNAQIPWSQPAGISNLVVTIDNIQSPPYPVTFTSQYCPLALTSSNPLIAYAPAFPFSATTLNSGGPIDAYTFEAPAAPNDTVFVVMTGLGPTDPSFLISNYGFSPAVTTPVVTVGTEQAQVLSCNLVYTAVPFLPELIPNWCSRFRGIWRRETIM